MYSLAFFSRSLVTLPSEAAVVVLAVLCGALALLAWALSIPALANVAARSQKRARRLSTLGALGVVGVLGVGLRIVDTGYGAAFAGPTTVYSALAIAIAGGIVMRSALHALLAQLPAREPTPKISAPQQPKAAVADNEWSSLETLRAAVKRLQATHAEALARAEGTEHDAANGYQDAADAIANKLALGQQLLDTAVRGAVKTRCRQALRDVLELRPDDSVQVAAQTPDTFSVDTAVLAIESFMEELAGVQRLVESERDQAPDALSKRFSIEPSGETDAALGAIDEVRTAYQAAHDKFGALRLKLSADEGAADAVRAARTLSADAGPEASGDPVDVAAQIANSASAALRAFESNDDDPAALREAVNSAASALSDDDERPLQDLLEAMRELS